jgi:hypothetical protein
MWAQTAGRQHEALPLPRQSVVLIAEVQQVVLVPLVPLQL